MEPPTPATDPPGPPAPAELLAPRLPTAGSAVRLFLGVVLLYLLAGIPFQLLLGEVGLALTQLTIFLGGTLYFVRRGGYDPVATLSLRRPERRHVLGGLVLLAGATPVAWFLAWLQSLVVPIPEAFLEAMSGLLETDDPLRMLWLLILVAVLPAICEEFLFRGAILSGLRSRFTKWGAIVLSGVLFGLVHAPQAVFRFLPTAWLGIVLAWVVWESRSLWVAVLLHFVNNGAILVLTLIPATRAATSDVDEPHVLLLPTALLLLYAGFRIVSGDARDTDPFDPPPGAQGAHGARPTDPS
jgi:sodium transport system permease protein